MFIHTSTRKRLGIIGGLGPLASADIFYKIVRHTPAGSGKEYFDIVFEQHPFEEGTPSNDNSFNPTARKLYVFNLIKQFETRKLDAVILPCFVSHTFYGSDGIKAGHLFGTSVTKIQSVCEHLLERGAQLLIPGFTEIPTVLDALNTESLPIVDSNRIYAEYAISDVHEKVQTNHRVSIGDGTDPTIQLFAACRQLEQDEVDFIAIPCNTAHAFVDRLQRYMSVPIVNMLSETVAHIGRHHPDIQRIGLLATTGSLRSHVYHDEFADTCYQLIEPDEPQQQLVMNAIYGEYGAKSGYTSGRCQDDLKAAVGHVVDRGAEAVILGCTELPLLVNDEFLRDQPANAPIYLDPTDILAQRCVHLVRLMSQPSTDEPMSL